MVKLLTLPDQAIIDGFKGKIDYYVHNGVQCVRRWPRYPPRKPSATEAEARAVFVSAVAAWTALPKLAVDAYKRWSSASSLSSRDLFVKGYIGGIYRYPKEIAMLPAAVGYKSVSQLNLTSGALTKVTWDKEEYDIGGNFDTVNSRFVAPRDGRYLILAKLLYSSTIPNKSYDCHIYKNGAGIRSNRHSASVADFFSVVGHAILDLVAADFIEIYAQQHSGVNTVDIYGGNIPNWTRFEISLIE